MLKRRISKDAGKTLDKMPDKQFCQLYDALEALQVKPEAHDSILLKGNIEPRRFRKNVGEYRIIYWFDEDCLYIDVIGKRNDCDVYKKARRKGIK